MNATHSALLPLAFGLLAAMANVLGGLAVTAPKRTNPQYLKYVLALGAGFMLAAAILKMMPESIQSGGPRAPYLILAGYLLVHLFEHSLVPHFHYGEETHAEEFHHGHASTQAYTVLVGLMIHTFFDGVSIASGFAVKPSFGVLLFIAALLHKLPEGATISSLMLATGHGRRAATLAAVAIGLATLAGVATITLWLGDAHRQGLAVAAGVTVYVAASDLIPIVNQEKGVRMAFIVFLGVLLFGLTEHALEAFGL